MRPPSNKADIGHVLKKYIESPTTWPAESMSETTVTIVLSVLIKKLYAVQQPKTFDKLCELILNHIISLCYRCIIVLLSCDLYCKEDDIKEY